MTISISINKLLPQSTTIKLVKIVTNMDQSPQLNNTLEPHVLIFPIPFQGPVNCALKLAELLCLSGIHVTFLNTEHIHRPLLNHTQVLSRFNRYPNFKFQTIPDGVDHEKPVSGDRFMEVMAAIDVVTKPLFREMMVSGMLSRKSERPVTVMIPDACFPFAVDIAIEASIPVIYLETISPCCLWTYMNLPALIEAGEVPFKGNDLDKLVTSVAGTKHIIRRRDFPSFCRSNDLSNPTMELIVKEAHAVPRAQGLILNTFEELDSLVLPHMRKLCPNIYTIGPLHTLHKTQLIANEAPSSQENIFSNSVWKEDRTCMSWLDKHDPKTVVYISIGSLATMTIEQLLEIWYGVVNSGKPFLWVRRPGSINGGYDESRIPIELLARTKEIGCIVEWAPQEDVLAHPAIGGFLTHSGWNSTMESIVEGVPMVCWPYFADQHANSRFVGEVWKLGIDMKDTCDRLLVEKAVRDIMESKHDVFTQSANTWLNLARESIMKTGSSSIQLGRLIDDIVAMSSTDPNVKDVS